MLNMLHVTHTDYTCHCVFLSRQKKIGPALRFLSVSFDAHIPSFHRRTDRIFIGLIARLATYTLRPILLSFRVASLRQTLEIKSIVVRSSPRTKFISLLKIFPTSQGYPANNVAGVCF